MCTIKADYVMPLSDMDASLHRLHARLLNFDLISASLLGRLPPEACAMTAADHESQEHQLKPGSGH